MVTNSPRSGFTRKKADHVPVFVTLVTSWQPLHEQVVKCLKQRHQDDTYYSSVTMLADTEPHPCNMQ